MITTTTTTATTTTTTMMTMMMIEGINKNKNKKGPTLYRIKFTQPPRLIIILYATVKEEIRETHAVIGGQCHNNYIVLPTSNYGFSNNTEN